MFSVPDPSVPISFATALFSSWILVDKDCEERDSEIGGLRRDLRIMVIVGDEPGGWETAGCRIGWGMRGSVYLERALERPSM